MLATPPMVGNKELLVGLVKPAKRKPCLMTLVLAINRPVVQLITRTPVKPLVKPAVILVPKVTPAPAVGNVAVRKTARPIILRKILVLPPKPVIH